MGPLSLVDLDIRRQIYSVLVGCHFVGAMFSSAILFPWGRATARLWHHTPNIGRRFWLVGLVISNQGIHWSKPSIWSLAFANGVQASRSSPPLHTSTLRWVHGSGQSAVELSRPSLPCLSGRSTLSPLFLPKMIGSRVLRVGGSSMARGGTLLA